MLQYTFVFINIYKLSCNVYNLQNLITVRLDSHLPCHEKICRECREVNAEKCITNEANSMKLLKLVD